MTEITNGISIEENAREDRPKLTREVLNSIGVEMRSAYDAADSLPVGEKLFELVEKTGFLDRFWKSFGGNPARWGGPPTGPELGLPLNHLDQRLVFASCSFDPTGKHCSTGQRLNVSCAYVAKVLRDNLDNVEMWKMLSDCLNGHDFVIVVALVHHRFQQHCH